MSMIVLEQAHRLNNTIIIIYTVTGICTSSLVVHK
jgi:hypothetical protein